MRPGLAPGLGEHEIDGGAADELRHSVSCPPLPGPLSPGAWCAGSCGIRARACRSARASRCIAPVARGAGDELVRVANQHDAAIGQERQRAEVFEHYGQGWAALVGVACAVVLGEGEAAIDAGEGAC